MAKISYEDEYNRVEIEVYECSNCTCLSDFVDLLVKPLLLAAGYSEKSVECLGIFEQEGE